jgi:hypothetical protein
MKFEINVPENVSKVSVKILIFIMMLHPFNYLIIIKNLILIDLIISVS